MENKPNKNNKNKYQIKKEKEYFPFPLPKWYYASFGHRIKQIQNRQLNSKRKYDETSYSKDGNSTLQSAREK